MTRLVWNAPQLHHVAISVALRMVHSKPVLHTLLMLELDYTHTHTHTHTHKQQIFQMRIFVQHSCHEEAETTSEGLPIQDVKFDNLEQLVVLN